MFDDPCIGMHGFHVWFGSIGTCRLSVVGGKRDLAELAACIVVPLAPSFGFQRSSKAFGLMWVTRPFVQEHALAYIYVFNRLISTTHIAVEHTARGG